MVRVSGAGPVLATGCRELTSHAAYLLEVEVGVTAPTSRRPDLSRSSECCHASGHMMLDGVTLYMVRPLILLRLPTSPRRSDKHGRMGAGRAFIN